MLHGPPSMCYYSQDIYKKHSWVIIQVKQFNEFCCFPQGNKPSSFMPRGRQQNLTSKAWLLIKLVHWNEDP